MSRAVWQLGQAVRECGIALERAGARLSTDYSFTEPRECSLCSFPPPCPSNPPPVVLGALPKVPARGSAEPGRVCVRVRREGCTLSSIIVPRVRGRAAGPVLPLGGQMQSQALRGCRQRQRGTAGAVPLSRLAIRNIAPAGCWRWRPSGEPCAVAKTPDKGGGDNRS
jgi:hypothetical protein